MANLSTQSVVSSPLNETPLCWQDDKRMNSIFSPFRQKSTNPIDYESKLNFWSEMIDLWCVECRRATLSVKVLQTAFKRRNALPSCLDTVFEELIRSGDLMRKDTFMSIDSTQSWASWAVKSIVKTPAIWSFNKLKETLMEIDPGEIDYVSIKYLKNIGNKVIIESENCDRPVMERSDFVTLVNAANEDEATLVLQWLINERKASTIMHGGKQIIKLGKNPVTEADIALMKINDTLVRLNKSVELLEIEKCQAKEDAKNNLRKNMRQTAKNNLRKMKELERQITKKFNAIDNLDVLLTRLKDAKTDAEILDSYKIGVSGLKNTFAETGLNEDTVASTMSELEEINEIHEEMNNTLSQPISATADDELESELMAMLNTPTKDDNSTQDLNLPDVPSSELSPTKTERHKESKQKFEPVY